MKARLRYRERIIYSPTEKVEMVAWQLPEPIPPSLHSFKYRLVYIVDGIRILGYDNERGKGDHRHYFDDEQSITFVSIETTLQAFLTEVETLRRKT
jgi:Family of unknown function (DUF6516)